MVGAGTIFGAVVVYGTAKVPIAGVARLAIVVVWVAAIVALALSVW